MAKNETTRVRPGALAQDRAAVTALQNIGEYRPANSAYARDTVQNKLAAMDAARASEAQAQIALDTARDNAATAEWEFHNVMLGVKDQIIAQFGKDSNQVQAIGLKKKSERKSPARKAKPK